VVAIGGAPFGQEICDLKVKPKSHMFSSCAMSEQGFPNKK